MGEVVPIRPKKPKAKYIRSCIRESFKEALEGISGEPIGAVIVILGHDRQMSVKASADPSYIDDFDLFSRALAQVRIVQDSMLAEQD